MGISFGFPSVEFRSVKPVVFGSPVRVRGAYDGRIVVACKSERFRLIDSMRATLKREDSQAAAEAKKTAGEAAQVVEAGKVVQAGIQDGVKPAAKSAKTETKTGGKSTKTAKKSEKASTPVGAAEKTKKSRSEGVRNVGKVGKSNVKKIAAKSETVDSAKKSSGVTEKAKKSVLKSKSSAPHRVADVPKRAKGVFRKVEAPVKSDAMQGKGPGVGIPQGVEYGNAAWKALYDDAIRRGLLNESDLSGLGTGLSSMEGGEVGAPKSDTGSMRSKEKALDVIRRTNFASEKDRFRAAVRVVEPACSGLYDLFDREDYLHEEQAKAICRTCPLVDMCLAYALEAREPSSVWGGMTPKERAAMLRRNMRARRGLYEGAAR